MNWVWIYSLVGEDCMTRDTVSDSRASCGLVVVCVSTTSSVKTSPLLIFSLLSTWGHACASIFKTFQTVKWVPQYRWGKTPCIGAGLCAGPTCPVTSGRKLWFEIALVWGRTFSYACRIEVLRKVGAAHYSVADAQLPYSSKWKLSQVPFPLQQPSSSCIPDIINLLLLLHFSAQPTMLTPDPASTTPLHSISVQGCSKKYCSKNDSAGARMR